MVGGLGSVSDTSGGGLRSLRIKRALVTGVGGGGSSLDGLDEREEMLLRSLVGGEEVEVEGILGLMRKRRTPFILMGTCNKNDVLALPTACQETVLRRTKNGEVKTQGNFEQAIKLMCKVAYTIFGASAGSDYDQHHRINVRHLLYFQYP